MFFCPVLGRPHKAEQLLLSWLAHSSYPITLLSYSDDYANDDYHELVRLAQADTMRLHRPNLISIMDLPRADRGTCDALNFAFRASPNLGYYGFIGEDVTLTNSNLPLVPQANYFGIAYPSDNIQNENLCTHPVIGGELVRSVGWLANPKLFHNFFDTSWMKIGQELSLLFYCPTVTYHHDHPLVGATNDDVYRTGQSHYHADEVAYQSWITSDLPKLVSRLKEI